jgi:predicted nucleotidyltransferase
MLTKFLREGVNVLPMEKVSYTTYDRLLKRFLDLVREEYKDKLISVVLYGSVARGEAKPTSDLDLILVIEAPPSSYEKSTKRFILKVENRLKDSEEFRSFVKSGFYPDLGPIILTRSEASMNRYVFLDLIKDAIILFDRNDFFKERLKALKKRLKELKSKKVELKDGGRYWILKPDLKFGEVFEL